MKTIGLIAQRHKHACDCLRIAGINLKHELPQEVTDNYAVGWFLARHAFPHYRTILSRISGTLATEMLLRGFRSTLHRLEVVA